MCWHRTVTDKRSDVNRSRNLSAKACLRRLPRRDAFSAFFKHLRSKRVFEHPRLFSPVVLSTGEMCHAAKGLVCVGMQLGPRRCLLVQVL
jgi:hypothetical protein